MSTDLNIFDCLLDPSEIFVLYQKLGTVLKNDRDIANERVRGRALHNTLFLLQHTAMIQKLDEKYIKLKNCPTIESFYTSLLEGVKNTYPEEVSSIINCDKHYDESKSLFFIYVNDIPLRHMGLAMLMEQTGEFERIKNKEYFIGINNYPDIKKEKSLISIEELQKKLQQDIEHGEQAEKYAFEYEARRLKQMDIKNPPVRISAIDVTAGYDIVSYESISSDSYDRFIEVKAVSKSGFFWSKNEYETAKVKRERYYLYLVELGRVGDPGYIPEIIQDPASTVMESDWWFVEAQSYHIRRL